MALWHLLARKIHDFPEIFEKTTQLPGIKVPTDTNIINDKSIVMALKMSTLCLMC